jgi:hypothetical protein
VTTIREGRLTELLFYFLRLGSIGFGGPVALVGQMERELVGERGWLTKEQMREAIAICQSLPGPLAIQVGIYVAYLRGGFWGAWIGGWAFILPNFVMVAALGALYVLSRRSQAGHRNLLRREPGRDRADPSLLYPPCEARHGGLAAMGHRARLPRGNSHSSGRSGVSVHRRRDHRHPLLWQPLSQSAGRKIPDRGCAANRRSRRGNQRDSQQAAAVLS